MTRPYIICHMTTSIDGKVTGDFLGSEEAAKATDIYYEINRAYKADAFACGRVTMESSFTGGWYPDLSEFVDVNILREDCVADKDATFFAVAFDRHGKLGWQASRIEDEDPGYGNSHIIEVLCENVEDAYLAYLRKMGISYIFAGEKEMNLPLALSKLKELFDINLLLLEGGSIINGSFQVEDVIDELSLVVAPVIADTDDKPLFIKTTSSAFSLTEVKKYDDGVIWMNYRKNI